MSWRLLAASFIGGYTSAHYSHSAAYCSDIPLNFSLDSPRSEDSLLKSCMRYLDEHCQWSVESTDFDTLSLRSDQKKACVQTMRLQEEFVSPDDGTAAPFLRVVGFFPGASSTEVFELMTDLTLRPRWDGNYRVFREFLLDSSSRDDNKQLIHGLEDIVNEVKRPIEQVAGKVRWCEGDTCHIAPDVTPVVVNNGIFCHRVGSKWLSKAGISERLFLYQRISTCYKSTKSPSSGAAGRGGENDYAPAAAMYDVLYSGSPASLGQLANLSPTLRSWMEAQRGETPAEQVGVNYQHFVLVPIADAEHQLTPLQFDKLALSGSMVNVDSTRNLYHTFKETLKLINNGERGQHGTLLIMTSANHVTIPKFMPRWTQSKLLAMMSRHVYDHLLHATTSTTP